MCGRYTLIAKAVEIEKRFNVPPQDNINPRFNAAPTQLLPVITNRESQMLSLYSWGLMPLWAKDNPKSMRIINVREESLLEKPAFTRLLEEKRCLIPATGYYEWKRITKKGKIPYYICLEKQRLFSFAGLWDIVDNGANEYTGNFSILTTSATPEIASIHDRMPVILPMELEKNWISGGMKPIDYLEIIKSTVRSGLNFHPVSSRVNSPMNDFPDLIEKVAAMDQFGNLSLFD